MNTTKNLIVPTFKVEAAYALGGWYERAATINATIKGGFSVAVVKQANLE